MPDKLCLARASGAIVHRQLAERAQISRQWWPTLVAASHRAAPIKRNEWPAYQRKMHRAKVVSGDNAWAGDRRISVK